MERVEVVGGNVFVIRTRQVGPDWWCCDLYERVETEEGVETFYSRISANRKTKRSGWRSATRTSPITSSITITDSRRGAIQTFPADGRIFCRS